MYARDLSEPRTTRRRLRVIFWALVRVRYFPVASPCVSKLGRRRRRVQVCAVLSLCRVQVAYSSRVLGASWQCVPVCSVMQDDTIPDLTCAHGGTPIKIGPSDLGVGPLTACGHNSAHPSLSPAQLTIARALEGAKDHHGAQLAASHISHCTSICRLGGVCTCASCVCRNLQIGTFQSADWVVSALVSAARVTICRLCSTILQIEKVSTLRT